MEIKIRKAENKDIEKIISLLKDIAHLHFEGRADIFKDGGAKYSENDLKNIISNEYTPVFVAEYGENGVIGYIFCQIKHRRETKFMQEYKSLYIDDLCVDKDFRGLGVGKKLFEYAEKITKDNGFDALELNVWNFNESAKKFYEKMGMRVQKSILEKKF